jgi:hypothetical protein
LTCLTGRGGIGIRGKFFTSLSWIQINVWSAEILRCYWTEKKWKNLQLHWRVNHISDLALYADILLQMFLHELFFTKLQGFWNWKQGLRTKKCVRFWISSTVKNLMNVAKWVT